jgi:hypothetical protein
MRFARERRGVVEEGWVVVDDQVLTFKVSVDEANLVLGALGAQPFQSVAGLIGKLQGQAAEQMQPTAEKPKR